MRKSTLIPKYIIGSKTPESVSRVFRNRKRRFNGKLSLQSRSQSWVGYGQHEQGEQHLRTKLTHSRQTHSRVAEAARQPLQSPPSCSEAEVPGTVHPPLTEFPRQGHTDG